MRGRSKMYACKSRRKKSPPLLDRRQNQAGSPALLHSLLSGWKNNWRCRKADTSDGVLSFR